MRLKSQAAALAHWPPRAAQRAIWTQWVLRPAPSTPSGWGVQPLTAAAHRPGGAGTRSAQGHMREWARPQQGVSPWESRACQGASRQSREGTHLKGPGTGHHPTPKSNIRVIGRAPHCGAPGTALTCTGWTLPSGAASPASSILIGQRQRAGQTLPPGLGSEGHCASMIKPPSSPQSTTRSCGCRLRAPPREPLPEPRIRLLTAGTSPRQGLPTLCWQPAGGHFAP